MTESASPFTIVVSRGAGVLRRLLNAAGKADGYRLDLLEPQVPDDPLILLLGAGEMPNRELDARPRPVRPRCGERRDGGRDKEHRGDPAGLDRPQPRPAPVRDQDLAARLVEGRCPQRKRRRFGGAGEVATACAPGEVRGEPCATKLAQLAVELKGDQLTGAAARVVRERRFEHFSI